jgi:5'-nucleotidase
MTKPFFLVSNDDGIHAPGLTILADMLRTLGDVMVVAPHSERSGQSQAITLTSPLRLHEHADNVFSVDGTPADCVMLALQHLVPKKPDWVVSGINRGGNLGTDILYSGTVGAAMEGTISGCKALAVSLEGVEKSPHRYEVAAHVVKKLLHHEKLINLQPDELLNLNVPNIPLSEVRGIRTATVGKRQYEGKMWERQDPRGHRYFWIGGNGFGHAEIEGSDCVLLHQGYATLSVLQPNYFHFDATQRVTEDAIEKLEEILQIT